MIAALILAGGAGTRLGGADKAFIQLAGQPLITHLLTRLEPAGGNNRHQRQWRRHPL